MKSALLAAVFALAIPLQCNGSFLTGNLFVERAAPALAGTWRMEAGDASTMQVVTLVLRTDGTYTKTLAANVGGTHYAQSHEGRWTAEGTVVHLSGSRDSRWPPYMHDLTRFHRVK